MFPHFLKNIGKNITEMEKTNPPQKNPFNVQEGGGEYQF